MQVNNVTSAESSKEDEFLAALRELVMELMEQAKNFVPNMPQNNGPSDPEGIRPAILGGSRNLDWAKRAYKARQYRKLHLEGEIFGEPSWDILLELYIAYHECRTVSTKVACLASDVPFTTAIRHMNDLERLGLIHRIDDIHDKRVKWVSLTKKAILAISRICEHEAQQNQKIQRKDAARNKETSSS